jgi:hypothetical protein
VVREKKYVYERRQTDMKEKFIKPEINVLLNVMIPNEDQNQEDVPNYMNDGDIHVSYVPGEGGENWDD